MLLNLAWRNIWRNRNRSLITMASIVCAVTLAVVAVSLQRGIYDNLIRNVVSLYTGNIQVHAKGYWKEQTLENTFEISDSLLQTVQHQAGVSLVVPRLESFALASADSLTRGCMVVGIVPEAEDQLTHIRNKIVAGHFFQDSSKEALVAEGLAQKLGLRLGDTIVLLSQGYYGSTAAAQFVVGGLLHFGSPDLNGRICYLPLTQSQLWLDAPARASALVLGLDEDTELHELDKNLTAALDDRYEVLTWEEMMPEIVQQIQSKSGSILIFLGVLYLLISFGIFSTLLMMLAERQREFGMLVALGMRRALIARIVLAESVFLTLCGGLIGVLLSWPITWYLNVHPIRIQGDMAKIYEKMGFEPVFPSVLQPSIFLNQTITIVCIGLVLAIYPAVRILRLNAASAIRQ